MGPPQTTTDPELLQRRIAELDVWYHTIDIAPGVTTPGWFDLRHIVELLPWPDVQGKRCLDIGTFDGFFAFELERRGAAEVIAVDVADHERLDWPADARDSTAAIKPGEVSLPPSGVGFRLAAELLGSKAEWRPLSIYELDPAEIGTFDVVICGSLLLHLRNPVRALEAVRSVCDGWLLSSDEMELRMSLLSRRPLFRLDGSGPQCQWWLPNAAGHERLLFSAGFVVEARSRPYVVRFNHNPPPPPTWRSELRRHAVGAITGDRREGVLHRALLARPRL